MIGSSTGAVASILGSQSETGVPSEVRTFSKNCGFRYPRSLPSVRTTPFEDMKNLIPAFKAFCTSMYMKISEEVRMPGVCMIQYCFIKRVQVGWFRRTTYDGGTGDTLGEMYMVALHFTEPLRSWEWSQRHCTEMKESCWTHVFSPMLRGWFRARRLLWVYRPESG